MWPDRFSLLNKKKISNQIEKVKKKIKFRAHSFRYQNTILKCVVRRVLKYCKKQDPSVKSTLVIQPQPPRTIVNSIIYLNYM